MASIKVRVFRQLLAQNGCTRIRQTGSHEVWELPNGHRIPLVVHQPNAELSRNVLGSMRREFERAGLVVNF
jgi:predicted RNA binding protein YcfA (HicA-like mRNA interferase family)